MKANTLDTSILRYAAIGIFTVVVLIAYAIASRSVWPEIHHGHLGAALDVAVTVSAGGLLFMVKRHVLALRRAGKSGSRSATESKQLGDAR